MPKLRWLPNYPVAETAHVFIVHNQGLNPPSRVNQKSSILSCLSTYSDSPVPRFLWGVVYRCRRGLRELGPQPRGSYRVPDRPRQGIRHIFSGNSQDMKGKMSRFTNHCQEKNMVEYCDSLAYRQLAGLVDPNNLAIHSEHIYFSWGKFCTRWMVLHFPRGEKVIWHGWKLGNVFFTWCWAGFVLISQINLSVGNRGGDEEGSGSINRGKGVVVMFFIVRMVKYQLQTSID